MSYTLLTLLMLAADQQSNDPGMPEWIKTLFAVLLGAIIPGVFLLLAEFLRHKRVQKERYETLIAERRVDAISALYKRILDLQMGGTLNFETDEYSNKALEIRSSVSGNSIVFGSEIQSVCDTYLTALSMTKTLTTKNHDIHIFTQVATKLGTELISKLNKAVESSFGGMKIQLLSSDKSAELRGAGVDMADKLVSDLRK